MNADDHVALVGSMTKQGRKALVFIRDHIVANGISPSLQEIGDGLGLASKSNIFRLLNQLVERGLIERKPYRARSIDVTARGLQALGENNEATGS